MAKDYSNFLKEKLSKESSEHVNENETPNVRN